MGRFLKTFILFSLLVTLAFAAPSETEEKSIDAKPKEEKKAVTAEERAVVVMDQTWENWLSQNSWSIATGVLGTVFLVGGISLAFYYFYFLNYNAYSNDAQANNAYRSTFDYSNTGGQYPTQYYATSRSLDSSPSGWNVNWSQVLYMISLAQESYEKFDFRSLDCQKKALCELAHKQGDFGETGRKISSSFSVMDAVEGLPMPTIIQTYLKEYRDAINQGKNGFKECGEIYPKCAFSIKEVVNKYQKKAAAAKF